MRAIWIEDHQLIGDSLEMLLQVVLPDLTLDKARDLASASTLARSFPYGLVLLDWWLDGNDGSESIRSLRGAGCHAPIVVVSGDDREPVMRRARELGVSGYVRKSAPPQELIDTVKAVLGGQRTENPPAGSGTSGLPPLDPALLFPSLTSRQLDVFRALLRGASDKQIARELSIADTTVKSHVRAILQELGVHSRGEAAFALRQAGF